MPDPEKYKGKRKPRKTRYEQLRNISPRKVQPPRLNGGWQLANWLEEAGVYEDGDNGPKPLSWQELAAWQQATGTAITPDELVLMRRLSRDYVAQYYASDDPACPSPTALKLDKDPAELSDEIDDAFDRAFG